MVADEAGEIDDAWRYALVRKAHPSVPDMGMCSLPERR
jgi:hypothetical protein